MNNFKKYAAEFIGTFVLVLFACGTAAVVGCDAASGFGPALFVGGEALKSVWVFLLAPLAGGVLAAITYKYLSETK